MAAFTESIFNSARYIFSMGFSDIIDIAIVAFLIYKLAQFIRKTNSSKVAQGLLILLVALWLSEKLNLHSVNFILKKTFELGLLAVVIVFQPEIRRVLEKMGSRRLSSFFKLERQSQSFDVVITQTVLACADMSKTKTGALIIFERDNSLETPMSTGTIINADYSAELLKNIFYPKSPLHDGAVIVSEGRIAAAGCMLPLSGNNNLSKELGMRHRAGIGMSEQSDALVVIVSEENGSISVAEDGMLKRHLSPETFEKLLRNSLMPDVDEQQQTGAKKFVNFFKVKRNGK